MISLEWDAIDSELTGTVIGQGRIYATTAEFLPLGVDLVFAGGVCTCPVGADCKHVAALAVAAVEGSAQITYSVAEPAQVSPSWEVALTDLVDGQAADVSGLALALDFALKEPRGREVERQLAVRMMRPGAREAWITGTLTWNALEAPYGACRDIRDDQLRIAKEIWGLHRSARSGREGYYYYHQEKALDLALIDSPRLWNLLDDALRHGVKLLQDGHALAPIRAAEVVFDITRQAAADRALVRARLRYEDELDEALAGPVEGDDRSIDPILFIGQHGNGLVCVERNHDVSGRGTEGGRIQLVRMTRPVTRRLQEIVLEDERIEIPIDQFDRFVEQHYPALRNVASVISSDGWFSPPVISAPSLRLEAIHGANRSLQLAWGWAYTVGSEERLVPLNAEPGRDGFRDLTAEGVILAETTVDHEGLKLVGATDLIGRPLSDPVLIDGFEAMEINVAVLPELATDSNFTIAQSGEAPEYRDVGESLQIGLSATDRVGDRDWFDLGVAISVEGRSLPFADVFVALASGESRMMLPDGAYFSLAEPRLQSLRSLIEEARALSDSAPDELRISRYQADLWSELCALGVVNQQAEAWQRQVGAQLELDQLPDYELPATLEAELRPYQREGFSWLATLWGLELGGILADDMGLGKTIQTLAMICHAREKNPDLEPILVIAPTSVVSNWVTEIARFAPSLRVSTVTETFAKSGRTIDDLSDADVVLTTYAVFRLGAEVFGSRTWAGLALDEAQSVKNYRSKTYKAVRELDAPFKLAITGTPMENNLIELWALLSITAPGLFPDPKRFAEHFARPIERFADRDRLDTLRRRIKPLIKRRTKELVAAELPPKQEQLLSVDLHPRHRKLYDTHLQRERQKILGLIDDMQRNRFTILSSITLLRRLSLHPGLIDEKDNKVPCAKLDAFAEQLQDVVGGGHRALVFSQFTGFLGKVRERLDQEQISYRYLDGRTRNRDRVINGFKDGDDPVFLISLKAGGFGLNLTEADYCFLLDPWWNPATEIQAIDRTHRIGQTRQVMVYRMIAANTIEEKVVALARRKAELFKGVMDDGDLFASSLNAEEIRGLLAG